MCLVPIVASERAGRSPAKRHRGAKEDFLRRLLLRVVGQGEDGDSNEDDGSESEPPQNIIGAGGGA